MTITLANRDALIASQVGGQADRLASGPGEAEPAFRCRRDERSC